VPVLYVTHNVGEALSLAETVLLLRDGVVEAHGPALDLLSRPTCRPPLKPASKPAARTRVAHDGAGGTESPSTTGRP
jgi:molybdate transport system ATP-binding protein